MFLSAVGGGWYLLQQEIRLPWSVTGVVAAYGLILVLALHNGHKRIGASVRDSPYFLGFVFTLASITLAFERLGIGSIDDVNVRQLLPIIGTALYTTVAGLIMRYYVAVVSERFDLEDDSIVLMREELKSSAAAYYDAQRSIVTLLSDFAERRSKLLDRETAASKALVDQFTTAKTELGNSITALTEEYRAGISSAQKTREDWQEKVDGVSDAAKPILEELIQHLKATRDRASALTQAIGSNGLGTGLQSASKVADQLAGSLKRLDEQSGTVCTTLNAMVAPAHRTQADLAAIDQLLDDFVKVLRRRIDRL